MLRFPGGLAFPPAKGERTGIAVGVLVGVRPPRLFFVPLFFLFRANLGSARDTDEGFDRKACSSASASAARLRFRKSVARR